MEVSNLIRWTRPLLLAALGLSVFPAASRAGFDADGDQTEDAADAYPCEAWAVGSAFAPAQGDHGMLLFEDLWPEDGDLDFNDVAVSYNYVFKLDAEAKVMGLRATFNVLSAGGDIHNGLSFHLPIPTASVKKVSRTIEGQPATLLLPALAESELTIVLVDDMRSLFPTGTLEGVINSNPLRSVLTAKIMEIDIELHHPVVLPLGGAPWDVFIFRTNDPTHEIHRPEYPGTGAMDTALFGTFDDGSAPGRYFVNAAGLPFALLFPTVVPYPAEGVPITNLYPAITAFATSAGTANQDFYTNGVQLQHAFSGANAEPPPAPGFIGPSDTPAETGCVVEWGLAVEWGTTRSIYAYGSAVSPSGQVVVTGYTEGAFLGEVNHGGFDAFVGKYDLETGVELWVTQFGGSGDDTGRDVVLDAAGNIYLAGDTTIPLNGQPNAGGLDAFVMKLDPQGNHIWTRLIGGNGDDRGHAVAIDAAGAVYVGGGSSSTSIPGASFPGNNPSSFLAKIDAQGTVLWTQQYLTDFSHPSHYNYTLDLATDPLSGDVYAVGAERRFGQDASASMNQFVVRHSGVNGAVLWVHHIGGHGYRNTGTDYRYAYAYGVAVDDFDGSAYVTGYWFGGSTVAAWGDWLRAAGDTSADATLVKIGPAGDLRWTHVLASSDYRDDFGEGVTADGLGGTVYMTGRTQGTLPGQISRGNDDYFVASYSYAGVNRWAIQDGTFAKDAGHMARPRMTSQSEGVVAVVGNTTGALFGPDGGHWDITFLGHDITAGAQLSAVLAARLGWRTSAWGQCSTACGDGIKARTVQCVAASGALLPSSACANAGPVPALVEECSLYSQCQHDWSASAWSPCSASCGSGARTRTVECMRTDGVAQPETSCAHAPRPAVEETCVDVSTCNYAWHTSAFGACVATSPCATGQAARSVLCLRSDGGEAPESACTAARPSAVQSCQLTGCSPSAATCATLASTSNAVTGVHDIDPDGAGGNAPFPAFCDMDADGGGWTNLDFAQDRLHLAGGHFIACTQGLERDATSVTCRGPVFDGDASKWLYQYRCDGTDRSADYLLDHVAARLGHNAAATLGFTMLAHAQDSSFGVSANDEEYCYVNGALVRWDQPGCAQYAAEGNGPCAVSWFRLSR